MPIFEIKNLKYKYDNFDLSSKYALDDVSFKINAGDVVALIGKSGSGKSTLISHLNGLYKATSGDILYQGKSIYSKDFDLLKLRFDCGIVFQYSDYQLFADTVIEDVSFGLIKKGLNKEDAYNKSMHMLDKLGIKNLYDKIPFNLSGGEKRKVALAGILVMEPKVLILDEPDAGLDSKSKRFVFEFLKSINEENNTTIIFITHDMDDVVEYAKKVILINDGKLISYGSVYDVFSSIENINKSSLIKPIAFDFIDEFNKKKINYDKNNLKFFDIYNICVDHLDD